MGSSRADHAARNAALASSRLSATPPFGPCDGARVYLVRGSIRTLMAFGKASTSSILLLLISYAVTRLVIGDIVVLNPGSKALVKTVLPSVSRAFTSANTDGRSSVSISQIIR